MNTSEEWAASRFEDEVQHQTTRRNIRQKRAALNLIIELADECEAGIDELTLNDKTNVMRCRIFYYSVDVDIIFYRDCVNYELNRPINQRNYRLLGTLIEIAERAFKGALNWKSEV